MDGAGRIKWGLGGLDSLPVKKTPPTVESFNFSYLLYLVFKWNKIAIH